VEAVAMCQRSEEYLGFMAAKVRAAVTAEVAAEAAKAAAAAAAAAAEGGADGPGPASTADAGGEDSDDGAGGGGGGGRAPDRRETALRTGRLSVAARELAGHYATLEEFYMDDCAATAIRIDEVPAGALTSSMVDDVFYVLRKSAGRALAGGGLQAAAALLAEMNNVLANSFRSALASRLASAPARLAAAAPGGGADGAAAPAAAPPAGAPPLREAAAALNNADVAAEYAEKLAAELSAYAADAFPSASDRGRLAGVLGDLAHTAGDFRQLASRALDALADALMPRLRPALDVAAGASYRLSEAEYAARDAADSWVSPLLGALEAQAGWAGPLLTARNCEALLQALVDRVAARLEALLSRKPFNQLGGLALDREARTLVRRRAVDPRRRKRGGASLPRAARVSCSPPPLCSPRPRARHLPRPGKRNAEKSRR